MYLSGRVLSKHVQSHKFDSSMMCPSAAGISSQFECPFLSQDSVVLVYALVLQSSSDQ